MCGVDEVGYSPIAGPVVAAAVVLPSGRRNRRLQGLRDSKQLSRDAREEFAATLREHAEVGIGSASVEEIDAVNIYQANRLAMARAIAALPERPDVALVDGRVKPEVDSEVHNIVRGDEKSLSIAAASIIAKVWRDGLMRRLAGAYPGYCWETNVGYGTEAHCMGLLRFGVTPYHRRSFAPLREWDAGSGIPRLTFEVIDEPLDPSNIETMRIQNNLFVVVDRARRHYANLCKGAGTDPWRLRAVGYDGPDASDGGGPLAPWHGARLSDASTAALNKLIA